MRHRLPGHLSERGLLRTAGCQLLLPAHLHQPWQGTVPSHLPTSHSDPSQHNCQMEQERLATLLTNVERNLPSLHSGENTQQLSATTPVPFQSHQQLLCPCRCGKIKCWDNTCSVASAMPNSATPWTVTYQALLSMGFSRQEYWSGLPCPPPGDLPNPGIRPISLMSPALAGGLFTASATWEGWWENKMISAKNVKHCRAQVWGALKKQAWGTPGLWE